MIASVANWQVCMVSSMNKHIDLFKNTSFSYLFLCHAEVLSVALYVQQHHRNWKNPQMSWKGNIILYCHLSSLQPNDLPTNDFHPHSP